MKKYMLIILLSAGMHTLVAQDMYYQGEWTTSNTSTLFTGLFKLHFGKDHALTGELVWTYLAADSTDTGMMEIYKGKKGRSGIEYVTGSFDPARRCMNFEGTRKTDPYEVIGTDIYTLKISADKKYIYGTTDDHGTNKGLFFASKVNSPEIKNEFRRKKAMIIKKRSS